MAQARNRLVRHQIRVAAAHHSARFHGDCRFDTLARYCRQRHDVQPGQRFFNGTSTGTQPAGNRCSFLGESKPGRSGRYESRFRAELLDLARAYRHLRRNGSRRSISHSESYGSWTAGNGFLRCCVIELFQFVRSDATVRTRVR